MWPYARAYYHPLCWLFKHRGELEALFLEFGYDLYLSFEKVAVLEHGTNGVTQETYEDYEKAKERQRELWDKGEMAHVFEVPTKLNVIKLMEVKS